MHSIRKFVSTTRFRMLALYLGVTLVSFAVIFCIAVNMMERFLVQENTSARHKELNTISYQLTQSIEEKDIDTMYRIIKQYAQSVNGRVLVLDYNYIVQADSAALYNGYYLPYDEAVRVLEGNSNSAYGFHRLENQQKKQMEWVSYYAQPLTANGMNRGVLLLAVSIQSMSESLSVLQTEIIVIFVVMIAAIFIVLIVVTARASRPLMALADVMRNATAKTFNKRVEIKGPGEIAELVDAFNRMGSELSAHDRIRDRFVADASHELKTPLASIKALSESVIYCEDPPAELMLEFLKDINNQVDRLNNIVQDLLQVARDSSEDVEYNMETLDFSGIVFELCHFIQPVAEKKDLKLTADVEDGIEIFGDKLRIERVVTNLVDNAIKYTEKGSISVKLRRDRREAVLSVKDTGIGIPEESIPRLFVRFYRVDKARSRATGGTGLGLSMVDEIVNRHGGNIKVESKVGEGSEFIVRIPLQK